MSGAEQYPEKQFEDFQVYVAALRDAEGVAMPMAAQRAELEQARIFATYAPGCLTQIVARGVDSLTFELSLKTSLWRFKTEAARQVHNRYQLSWNTDSVNDAIS